jgi:hypothetical protein
MRDQITDAAIGSLASKTTTTGGAAAVAGWLTANTVLGIAGFLVAAAGLLVTWVYKHRDDVRRREIHEFDRQLRQRELARSMPEWEQKPYGVGDDP